MKCYQIYVYGLVQGVGFRYTTKIIADKLGITGIVKNLSDGTVYIEAQGDSLILSKFISSIKKPRPSFAKVDKINLADLPLNDAYYNFSIVY